MRYLNVSNIVHSWLEPYRYGSAVGMEIPDFYMYTQGTLDPEGLEFRAILSVLQKVNSQLGFVFNTRSRVL
jgi:hypothetical protein